MNSPGTGHGGALWAPLPPSTGRARKRWQRMLSIGAVVGVHIVLVVMFAARPFGSDAPAVEPVDVVYVDSEVTRPEPAAAEPGSGEFAPEVEARADGAAPGEGTPRLVRSSAPDRAEFARRAGMAPGKSARVVLSVKVSESGRPGEIQVVTSSGSSRVDAQAVRYARALRWSPAIRDGRASSAEIQLPVVLETPG